MVTAAGQTCTWSPSLIKNPCAKLEPLLIFSEDWFVPNWVWKSNNRIIKYSLIHEARLKDASITFWLFTRSTRTSINWNSFKWLNRYSKVKVVKAIINKKMYWSNFQESLKAGQLWLKKRNQGTSGGWVIKSADGEITRWNDNKGRWLVQNFTAE